MDLLIAIAALCQVSGGLSGPAKVDNHQLACQKQYLKCYFGRVAAEGDDISEKTQQKFLYQCVQERKCSKSME